MDTLRPDAGTDAAIARALATLRVRSAMDIAFGAKVSADARAMRITHLHGARTRSLSGLTITNGAGLGGKSLALGQPTRVRDYVAAKGITHVYDHAVRSEQLCTVAALPVRVAQSPRYVVYLGSRRPTELGDRWLDRLTPTIRELEREIAVQDEVARRMRLLTPRPLAQALSDEPRLSAGELREIAAELAGLAGELGDEALRNRILALESRVAKGRPATVVSAQREPRVQLTPRETAVLAEVAAGCTNAVAAERLGLLPNTVKSYLKSAMRKLGAHNRVQAITAAREAGVIG